MVIELSSIIKVSKYSYTMSRILKMLENLPENRLPTKLQVLQRFEHMRKNNNTNELVSSLIDTLIKEISTIWNKAYIPIQSEKNIKRKLDCIIKRYNSKKKNVKKSYFNLSSFEVLFDIKSSSKFRNKEDEDFYLDQKDKRKATIGTVDLPDSRKITQSELRKMREEYEEIKPKQKGV